MHHTLMTQTKSTTQVGAAMQSRALAVGQDGSSLCAHRSCAWGTKCERRKRQQGNNPSYALTRGHGRVTGVDTVVSATQLDVVRNLRAKGCMT